MSISDPHKLHEMLSKFSPWSMNSTASVVVNSKSVELQNSSKSSFVFVCCSPLGTKETLVEISFKMVVDIVYSKLFVLVVFLHRGVSRGWVQRSGTAGAGTPRHTFSSSDVVLHGIAEADGSPQISLGGRPLGEEIFCRYYVGVDFIHCLVQGYSPVYSLKLALAFLATASLLATAHQQLSKCHLARRHSTSSSIR